MPKVFVILSGVGDRQCSALGGETPLEAAETRNLDYISANGSLGYVYALSTQIPPKSDESFMAMLGYDPYKYYTGGGPLAAYGAGFDYKDGWLALKTNFSSVEKNKIIERRTGRSLTTKEAAELAESINKNLKLEIPFVFRQVSGHEGFLVLKENLSPNISNLDPAYKKVGKFGITLSTDVNAMQECRALDPDKKTKLSAKLVNEFALKSREILEHHIINEKRSKKYLLPANMVIPRDAGNSLPLLEKRNNWCAVTGTASSSAIAKLAGMKVPDNIHTSIESTDIFEHLSGSLEKQINNIKKLVRNEGFEKLLVYFHQPNICGMENRPKEKKKMIEIIDKHLFNFLLNIDNLELVVAGDHSTPCEIKMKSSDPVPLVHYGKGKEDEAGRFTEKECLKGHYRKVLGRDVMKITGFV